MKYNLKYYGGRAPNLVWYNNRCFGDSVMQMIYRAYELRDFILKTDFNDIDKKYINMMNGIKEILREMKANENKKQINFQKNCTQKNCNICSAYWSPYLENISISKKETLNEYTVGLYGNPYNVLNKILHFIKQKGYNINILTNFSFDIPENRENNILYIKNDWEKYFSENINTLKNLNKKNRYKEWCEYCKNIFIIRDQYENIINYIINYKYCKYYFFNMLVNPDDDILEVIDAYNNKYKLISVIINVGLHYISYINDNNQWLLYNDMNDNIELTTFNDIKEKFKNSSGIIFSYENITNNNIDNECNKDIDKIYDDLNFLIIEMEKYFIEYCDNKNIKINESKNIIDLICEIVK